MRVGFTNTSFTANFRLPESLNACHSDLPTSGEESIFSLELFTDNRGKQILPLCLSSFVVKDFYPKLLFGNYSKAI